MTSVLNAITASRCKELCGSSCAATQLDAGGQVMVAMK